MIMDHLKNGYLDGVFSVFRARQHPIVLVEEGAMRWMGIRVGLGEDIDLLIRDAEMEGIQADLVKTGQYEVIKQDLRSRSNDTYTQQVPRLQLKLAHKTATLCISLWSESVYMLTVDGEKVEVPDPVTWNMALMEDRFDLKLSWANACPVGYTVRISDGVKILPPVTAQIADPKYPVFIPTIPRMLDALLDQTHYRVENAEKKLGPATNRPRQHLLHFIRYLHLEHPEQQERMLPELVERNREAMVLMFVRKPLATLANLHNAGC